jgi:hypothetical protein
MLAQNILEWVDPASSFVDTEPASEIAFAVRRLLAVEQQNTFAAVVAAVGKIAAAAAAAAAVGGGMHFVVPAAAVEEAEEWPPGPHWRSMHSLCGFLLLGSEHCDLGKC